MIRRNPLMLYLLTFGPLLITLFGWFQVVLQRERGWPRTSALAALAVTTANALIASWIVLYYAIHPTPPKVPPWEDPQVLDLGMQFLLAPVGIVLGIVAGTRGAPKWLVAVVEVASIPLCVIGFFATVSF